MKWLLLCAALALGLSACSGGADPKPTFTPTATAVETPSPTEPTAPAEPTLPATAKRPTKAGAEAFVRYYVNVGNFAQRTGDTALLKSLSADTCGGCLGAVDAIRDVYGAGGWARGAANHSVLNRTEIVAVKPPAYSIDITIRHGRGVIYEPNKGRTHVAPSSVSAHLVVSWANHAWRTDVWEVA